MNVGEKIELTMSNDEKISCTIVDINQIENKITFVTDDMNLPGKVSLEKEMTSESSEEFKPNQELLTDNDVENGYKAYSSSKLKNDSFLNYITDGNFHDVEFNGENYFKASFDIKPDLDSIFEEVKKSLEEFDELTEEQFIEICEKYGEIV